MQENNYPHFLDWSLVNLAEDAELLELMAQGLYGVFLGIEPQIKTLKLPLQGSKNPLVETCRTINQAGLLIYAGFIIGFDGERTGAGERIQAFVEETIAPQPMLEFYKHYLIQLCGKDYRKSSDYWKVSWCE